MKASCDAEHAQIIHPDAQPHEPPFEGDKEKASKAQDVNQDKSKSGWFPKFARHVSFLA